MRTPARDVCPHYAFSKRLNESYSFSGGDVSCASSQDWHVRSRTSCHVSNTEWQGGGRNTGEVTAPESPPGHQGAVGGSLWCINQTPCGTMRGPEPQAGPEAARVWYGDPGGSSLRNPPTPGLSLPDFHPQLPNSILLRLCHQPISRRILSMLLFIMKELSRAQKAFPQRCESKYCPDIVPPCGWADHVAKVFYHPVFISITWCVYSVGSIQRCSETFWGCCEQESDCGSFFVHRSYLHLDSHMLNYSLVNSSRFRPHLTK